MTTDQARPIARSNDREEMEKLAAQWTEQRRGDTTWRADEEPRFRMGEVPWQWTVWPER